MSNERKSCTLEHSYSSVEFKIYYDFDGEDAEITGLYIAGHHQDLIDIISDEVKEELENDIISEVEGL